MVLGFNEQNRVNRPPVVIHREMVYTEVVLNGDILMFQIFNGDNFFFNQ